MFVAGKNQISANGFLFTRCENLLFNASNVLFRMKKKKFYSREMFGGIR